MRTPKENKQKLRDRTPKSTAGTIPKAALKAVWLKTKEQARTAARENDTESRQQEPTDFAGSAAEQSASFVLRQGRKLAETQARQRRQKEAAARAHAANERGVSPKQVECGTLPDAEPRPRRGADLPRQRAKEKAITAKTAPRDIRGVTQDQRQLRIAANETVRSVTTQARMQTHAQKIRLAAQKAAAGTGRTAVAVRSVIRHFLASLHSLITILAAGAGAALGIVIVICLVAFVSGSAYGIFFAANAPNAASVTVREAVETLTAEYRDRLEEISDTVQHDRQDITANDDVYYIRWQDVLAVFSSYVAGSEQGAPVAALTEEQVDKLREIMWAMNAVDYSTRAETAVIETTDKNGKSTTTEITETVLVIELTHKTPDEMAADYHFTTRQNTYLQLLQDPQYEELWAELLGGFAQGGGEVMSPDGTRAPTGTLQWPLPVAGTITSQFGHRVDPITGEVSSHTGTDIACAEGTPILAAADGTVTVANGLDSWGGSYGYYIPVSYTHLYYGQNAVSKNMIVADRRLLLNGNSFRLGVSGSGKSMSAKEEIVQIALSTEDDILILDPESEFGYLTEALGGEVIRISATSDTHINALDMDRAYGDERNPIVSKSEFVLSLFEQLIGDGMVTAKEKSILGRCTEQVYLPYIRNGYKGTPPTLQDFYRLLQMQPEPEAQGLALSSELFITGTLNTFARHTNVDTQARIIAYDIRELGEQLMPLGMLVTLDAIYNRVIQNWKKGRRTWIFCDEFYILFRYEYSANFFYKLWRCV